MTTIFLITWRRTDFVHNIQSLIKSRQANIRHCFPLDDSGIVRHAMTTSLEQANNRHLFSLDDSGIVRHAMTTIFLITWRRTMLYITLNV